MTTTPDHPTPQFWTCRATRPIKRDSDGRITAYPEERTITVVDRNPIRAARRAVQYFRDATDWTVQIQNDHGDYVTPDSKTLHHKEAEYV